MFSISFTDDPPDYLYDDPQIPSQSGLLVLGKTIEGFSSNLGTWDKSQYEDQWLSQLSSLVQGSRKVALVVSFNNPAFGSNFEIWALYREGEIVHLQNHLPWYDSFPAAFDISTISDHLREREVNSSEGSPISEWRLPVRDFELFLRRASRPLRSHIPRQISRGLYDGCRGSPMDTNFPHIEIRSSAAGDQAYIRGSSLAVWEVAMLIRSYDGDLQAVANHLQWPLARVEAAAQYASEFPDEINRALEENDAIDFDSLKRTFPDILEFRSSVVARR